MSGCPFNPHGTGTDSPTPSNTSVGGFPADSFGDGQPPGAPFAVLGFETARRGFLNVPQGETEQQKAKAPTHYSSYLAVDRLLRLQEGEAGSKPEGHGMMHHEELTFIIVHQVFELWFKLVTADLNKAREYLITVSTTDSQTQHDRMLLVVQYLRRAELIFQHVQGAFGVMESMHPGDFIEFRDFLVPASGFQSVGFRSLEQLLGVSNLGRQDVNGASVFSYLKPEEQRHLELERSIPSINELLIKLCSSLRVPDNFVEQYLATHRRLLEEQQFVIAGASRNDQRAIRLIEKGVNDLKAMFDEPAEWSEGLFLPDESDAKIKYRLAVIGGLLAISYRHSPRFSLFAQMLDQLIAVEEGLMLWRSRHSHMAERMIGRRMGTGGSNGVGYLDVTRRYRVFHSLWLARKMLIRASALPPLSSFGDYEAAPFFL